MLTVSEKQSGVKDIFHSGSRDEIRGNWFLRYFLTIFNSFFP